MALGAPYAFQSIPPFVGQVMFWCGVGGLIVYPSVQAWRSRKAMEPHHLIVIGLAATIIGASTALAGFVWQQYREPKLTAAPAKPTGATTSRAGGIDVKQKEAAEPKRHYSPRQRDELANVLDDIEKVIHEKVVVELLEESQKIAYRWDLVEKDLRRKNSNDLDEFVNRARSLDHRAEETRKLIYEKFPIDNHLWKNLIYEVLGTKNGYGYANPLNWFQNAAESYANSIDAIARQYKLIPQNKEFSTSIKDLNTLFYSTIIRLSDARQTLSEWVGKTNQRIEDKKKSILSGD